MAILERHVQTPEKGKREAYKEFEESTKRSRTAWVGSPAKKHYGAIAGPEPFGTVVWEREWESFTAMEAAYGRMMVDPKPELEGNVSPLASERTKYYWCME